MKLIKILILLVLIFTMSSAFAQPTAQEISTQIQTYWKNSQFSDLENYINTLYQQYPNYIPVILAKSFYHLAFLNNMTDSLAELNRVVDAITNNPQLGTKDFRERVDGEKRNIELLISDSQKRGETQGQLTAAASVERARNAWGDRILPEFKLIASAPNESI